MCGENQASDLDARLVWGSSPRVRGKLETSRGQLHEFGLIPACAGKTGVLDLYGNLRSAHPRVCGENRAYDLAADALEGSSPRVRGKRQMTRPFSSVSGLIPACAGKTSNPFVDGTIFRAHPRVCGENSKAP